MSVLKLLLLSTAVSARCVFDDVSISSPISSGLEQVLRSEQSNLMGCLATAIFGGISPVDLCSGPCNSLLMAAVSSARLEYNLETSNFEDCIGGLVGGSLDNLWSKRDKVCGPKIDDAICFLSTVKFTDRISFDSGKCTQGFRNNVCEKDDDNDCGSAVSCTNNGRTALVKTTILDAFCASDTSTVSDPTCKQKRIALVGMIAAATFSGSAPGTVSGSCEYDFGGIYMNQPWGSACGTTMCKNYNNPITGAQSCPSGYTAHKFMGQVNANTEGNTFLCRRPRTATLDGARWEFGGAFGFHQKTNIVGGGQYENANRCPEGFEFARMAGNYGKSYEVMYCWRAIPTGERAQVCLGNINSAALPGNCNAGYTSYQFHGDGGSVDPNFTYECVRCACDDGDLADACGDCAAVPEASQMCSAHTCTFGVLKAGKDTLEGITDIVCCDIPLQEKLIMARCTYDAVNGIVDDIKVEITTHGVNMAMAVALEAITTAATKYSLKTFMEKYGYETSDSQDAQAQQLSSKIKGISQMLARGPASHMAFLKGVGDPLTAVEIEQARKNSFIALTNAKPITAPTEETDVGAIVGIVFACLLVLVFVGLSWKYKAEIEAKLPSGCLDKCKSVSNSSSVSKCKGFFSNCFSRKTIKAPCCSGKPCGYVYYEHPVGRCIMLTTTVAIFISVMLLIATYEGPLSCANGCELTLQETSECSARRELYQSESCTGTVYIDQEKEMVCNCDHIDYDTATCDTKMSEYCPLPFHQMFANEPAMVTGRIAFMCTILFCLFALTMLSICVCCNDSCCCFNVKYRQLAARKANNARQKKTAVKVHSSGKAHAEMSAAPSSGLQTSPVYDGVNL